MKIKLKTREEIPLLLKYLKLNKVGAEIGVQTGIFSDIILRKSNLILLWSIDCWEHQKNPKYLDVANHGNLRQKYYLWKTKKRLKKFKNRSKILKAYSHEIPKKYDFLNNLDFVYIDADHTYEGCKKDLKIWYPRVKQGGILAGHDYFNGNIKGAKNVGVKKAVDELIKQTKEKLHVTQKDFPKSWFIIKGEKEL